MIVLENKFLLKYHATVLLCYWSFIPWLCLTRDWQLKFKVPQWQETLPSLSLSNISIFTSWPLLVPFPLKIFLELLQCEICLQINLIGIDHTHKVYLCTEHKGSQSINLASMCAEKKGSSNKTYMNTDDEGPCRQFREWYIWTYKLFWFVYALENLKKQWESQKKKYTFKKSYIILGGKKRQHQTLGARVIVTEKAP